jgi:hypothetical protein
VACALERLGSASPRALRGLGTGARTRCILYDDVYGWFVREGRALYALSTRGRTDLERYAEVAAGYRDRVTQALAATEPDARAAGA